MAPTVGSMFETHRDTINEVISKPVMEILHRVEPFFENIGFSTLPVSSEDLGRDLKWI